LEKDHFYMASNKALFDGVDTFVKVVETGGFTAAARSLGHSPSHISKEIVRLETRLGIRLLHRTTRSISLTDLGSVYYERCVRLVADAQEAARRVIESDAEPQGMLKISAPVGFGFGYLSDLLPTFLEMYPRISLDLAFTDRMVDVVAEGFDLVMRVGPLTDSSLIARQISTTRSMTVVAPVYLELHGTPTHPTQLADHACISYANMQNPNQWIYHPATGQPQMVSLQSRITCNSAELERVLAVRGLGITRLPQFACFGELEQGTLVPILEEFEGPPMGIFAIYPHRGQLSPKVRLFVDFLVERLGLGAPG
jgi:DNA-binding transcriptional LysR family regulator